MPETKEGPKPPDDAAGTYYAKLNAKLKPGGRWHGETRKLLYDEYEGFVRLAQEGCFGTHSMWEYERLVATTQSFLYYKASKSLSVSFHGKVSKEFGEILKWMELVPLEPQQQIWIEEAKRRILSVTRMWGPTRKARD